MTEFKNISKIQMKEKHFIKSKKILDLKCDACGYIILPGQYYLKHDAKSCHVYCAQEIRKFNKNY